jgi:thiamine pyrophosphate-dependent acetolactate synthase large subunit-like protein
MGASEPRATAAVRALLKRHAIPAVGTFQGPGVTPRFLRLRNAGAGGTCEAGEK